MAIAFAFTAIEWMPKERAPTKNPERPPRIVSLRLDT
jgi:hypothetical protein